MARKAIVFSLMLFFVISLNGCATVNKESSLETQGLRNQVSALEAELQAKDEEINTLRDSLSKSEEEKERTPKEAVKARPSPKQIQMALKNAGYNPGNIDGRLGRKTKDAIRAFQKANNLSATGKVNEETWDLLKEFLYKKVK